MRAWTFLAAIMLALPIWAADLGDDGLHKADWMRDTFKDLREDLEEANAEGKRLLLIVEQRGCIYCKKMHEEVFVMPEIAALLRERYFIVQINMFGDVEVTDFDGETLSEKEIVKRWGALFTPNMIFLPQEVPDNVAASQAAVANMPGAFGKWTTLNLLNWVLEEGYLGDEPFQKYHARKFSEQGQ
ncbi:thioredoxin family protein [Shimia sp.]|uniref:thioredoxin family protein n=1 Tax=Shimia sp. TaxID=1954381 RepID=UPI003299D9C5